jgi:hypothetical protein
MIEPAMLGDAALTDGFALQQQLLHRINAIAVSGNKKLLLA